MRVVLYVLLAMLAMAAFLGFGAWFEYRSLRAYATTPVFVREKTVVEIPTGAGPRIVAKKLFEARAISDAGRFGTYVRFVRRVGGQFKAGEYAFDPEKPQTPDEVIDRLLKGEVLELRFTIPEGLRIDEQAKLVEAAGFGTAKEFEQLARDPAFAKTLGIPADSLEGYLYPDTYSFPRRTTTKQVLEKMVASFEVAWTRAQAKRDPVVTLSKHQAVTLASIVEKETGAASERPRISCIFHNRLKKDMKLQTDPTVIYAEILRKGSYDGDINRSDLDAVHPYNTYAVKGLPPGPISNAGEAALAAALAPLTCDDLFFVSRNDGTHVFCPTLACHETAVEKWQREYFRRKKAGLPLPE